MLKRKSLCSTLISDKTILQGFAEHLSLRQKVFVCKGQNGSLRENNCSLNVEASFLSVFSFLVRLSGGRAEILGRQKLLQIEIPGKIFSHHYKET